VKLANISETKEWKYLKNKLMSLKKQKEPNHQKPLQRHK
jgi:hypothetical protein